MARPKKLIKAKEPVRLREQVLKDGRKSLYLDIYQNGKRSYKFLKLYLSPAKDPASVIENANILAQANAIKDEMIYDMTNRIAGITDKSRKARMLLVEWMEQYEADVARRGTKIGSGVKRVIEELNTFSPTITVEDTDKDFIRRFFEHLLSVKSSRSNEMLNRSTAFTYLTTLRAALNYAVRENVIGYNPFRGVKENIARGREHKREYLTVSEVQKLIETPCPSAPLKEAFLFSCFCGLRISDIAGLQWKHLTKNGNDWQVEIIQFKTKTPIYLPLNMNARKWLPERGAASDEERIFSKFNQWQRHHIKDWMESAGISKPISFHCARHTFATLCLTAGIDIYTTSQLLGHANIRHTQRYARIINAKKDAVVSLLDSVFE
ncbi:MAG: site-specific integrase [Bacteroides sp.]|nr:site-specific integrase [Roseburia sp.]MCM1346293.1 site-specific integrase [Bacteroides sp.]MCM1420818.1 site-specific integrase [Bacteroides sp.]